MGSKKTELVNVHAPIVRGVTQYGKVDQCPGLFHVVTDFRHIWFVPVKPKKSYVVLQRKGGSQEFGIPLSKKSINYAYFRTATFVLGLLLPTIALALTLDARIESIAWQLLVSLVTAGAAAWGLFFLSYRLSRAGPERAVMIAQEAGIDPRLVAKHCLSQGMTLTNDE